METAPKLIVRSMTDTILAIPLWGTANFRGGKVLRSGTLDLKIWVCKRRQKTIKGSEVCLVAIPRT